MVKMNILKVVCIRYHTPETRTWLFADYKPLVVGDIYDAVFFDTGLLVSPYYYINGYFEEKELFCTLSEHRQKQLESILV